MTFQKFKAECEELIKSIGLEPKFEIPPKGISDLALPCFFAKNPTGFAKKLQEKLKKNISEKSLIGNIKAVGPYLNFYLNHKNFNKLTLTEILKHKDKFGKGKRKNKKIMIEYSAPNPNKPLHLGHLRNDSIGMAVANILDFFGYDVIKANLINDRGIHICKVMVAYEKFAKDKTPESENKKPDHFVGDLYVLFSKKSNQELIEEARKMLKKWENGDKKIIALWKKIVNWSIKGIKETYKKFGSEFDVWFFESDFYKKAKPIINMGMKKGIFKMSDKGIIADLSKHNLPNKVIVRPDGTSIYITNDLALTKYKFEKYKLDKSIWCVASEQNLYFKQLFKIFELLGFSWAKKCYHLSFGMVNLTTGKMKSREGKVVDADNLINDVVNLAKNEIKKRNPKLDGNELENRALKIAVGAIKYYLLNVDITKDITFDPKKAISFEGDTGPYLQYTYARACSILRKAGKKHCKNVRFELLKNEIELDIIKKLSKFPIVIEDSARDMKPNYIANYLLDLAATFNEFYHKMRVIGSNLEKERLTLTKAVAIVLQQGLSLLGIPVLKEM